MNINKRCGIYKIKYKSLIYIGQSVDVKHRWITHLSALRNNKHDNNRLQNICNKYGINNLNFSVIEDCKELELTNKEQNWSDFYRNNKNYDVINLAEFVSSSMRGRKHSKKTKEKISNSKKGKMLSEKHKQRISKGNKGKILTEKTKRKISEANKGEKHYMFGKHHSSEWKERNSKIQKGRIKSKKECKKISKAKMGHKVSKETKIKISQSLMGHIPWNKGKKL